MNWPRVPLSSVAHIEAGGKSGQSGFDFASSGYPAYGAGGANGLLPGWEHEDSAVILSSIGARCGKCFLPNGKWTSLANTQLIFPNPKLVDRKFLWYQLNDEFGWHRSGTAQPYIKPSDVRAKVISLPPLPEQRRIAEILDLADELRANRRRALTLLDEFLEASFIDMFENQARTSASHVRDLLLRPLRNGISPSSRGTVDGDVLTLSAITQGKFDASMSKSAKFDRPHDPAKTVLKGELLICRGNGNKNLVGRGELATVSLPNVAFPDTMIAARFDERLVNPVFIQSVWHRPEVRRQIEAGARTTNGTFKVNQEVLESVEISVPPLGLQHEYASRATAIGETTRRSRVHLAKLDELFASLQQRAFSGQL